MKDYGWKGRDDFFDTSISWPHAETLPPTLYEKTVRCWQMLTLNVRLCKEAKSGEDEMDIESRKEDQEVF